MDPIVFAKTQNGDPIGICPDKLNRHGLIAGATGTGKTVSLKVLAENFSEAGIPSFICDIKGDIASIAEPAQPDEKIINRVTALDIKDYEPTAYPVEFYDVFGEKGLPLKARISDMGGPILSKILSLNDTQEGVLNICFKVADEAGLLLYDLKDLSSMLNFMLEHREEVSRRYGQIAPASVNAILRGLLLLEEQGADHFFGEPAFDIADLCRCNENGQGIISILNAVKLFESPRLYTSFLFWLLAELYENLPEIGDPDKPKLVFFFDEAHVLFKENNALLTEKIEMIVKLIRSKGVGVFFVTQNPLDIPDRVLSQLGNKIQHGMRAFTAKDKKAVKAMAENFRTENVDLTDQLLSLEVGQAIISCLDEKAIPDFARVGNVYPPRSKMGVISPETLRTVINRSPLYSKYTTEMDSYSAYEALEKFNAQQQPAAPAPSAPTSVPEKEGGLLGQILSQMGDKKSPVNSSLSRLSNNILGQIGREIGRQITRNLFGTRRK